MALNNLLSRFGVYVEILGSQPGNDSLESLALVAI
jgi:hypothetical protein